MNAGSSKGGKVRPDDLTWREQEILFLLAERMTNREIADQLHLAESTVKDYVGKILSKLYVKNRREAVERAKTLGLLETPKKPVPGLKSNLPSERTPFIGRKEELAEINRQLTNTRLLSLTGPGGMGKTRLALKAAEGLTNEYKDGVFFVSLAPIREARDITQTIAEGLKFPIATHEDPQLQLLRYLSTKELLLVIDNFEHLLDGIDIINEILQAAPEAKILTTSRERLNLQSETAIRVGGLGLPDQNDFEDSLSFDAISLFLQSAIKVRQDFDPSPAELEVIVRICHLVGGMPLAIELAAAWLHVINVDEIATELEKDFDILVTEVRDTPDRHRSIRTVFDHSWSLLESTEGEIFSRLSVFRGGFTREAAEQVAGAALTVLAGFVNKSFLSHDPASDRYEVHELLRQYAGEKLTKKSPDDTSTYEKHAAYYANFMERKWEDLKSSDQLGALIEIEADIENIRTAWRFCLGQKNISQIWKLIYGIWHFYWIRWWNHAGMELFAEAVSAFQGEEDEESVAIRASAGALQSYFMGWLGLAQQGYELAVESIRTLEGLNYPVVLALAYHSLTVNLYFIHRYTEGIQAMSKMFEIASKLGDKWLMAFSLFGQSLMAIIQEDYGEARKLADQNLCLYEEVGDVIGSTTPLIVMGHSALAQGDLNEAKKHYQRCLGLAQETSFYYSIQTSSKYLCKVTLSLGMLEEAEEYLLQSLKITKEIGFVRDIVNLLYEYARLLVARNDKGKAVEILVLVIQHPASDLYRMLEGSIKESAQDLLNELKNKIPQDVFEPAYEKGLKLDLDEVVAEIIT